VITTARHRCSKVLPASLALVVGLALAAAAHAEITQSGGGGRWLFGDDREPGGSPASPLRFDPVTGVVTVHVPGEDATALVAEALDLCASIGPTCAIRLVAASVQLDPAALAAAGWTIAGGGPGLMLVQEAGRPLE
jgi:hypothetical protein